MAGLFFSFVQLVILDHYVNVSHGLHGALRIMGPGRVDIRYYNNITGND